MPKGLPATKYQAVHVSSANNQSKETLRLGGRHCRHIFASLEVLVSLSRGRGNNGGIVSADSCTTPSSSMVSPWSDNNSKKHKNQQYPMEHCATLPVLLRHNFQNFVLQVQILEVPLTRDLTLQSALMRPMRPQWKRAVSVLLFPLPLRVLLLTSYRGLVKTFLPFPIAKRYTSPSSLSTNSS